MKQIKSVLLLSLLALTLYTAVVIHTYGWNLLPHFFGNIAAMNWNGQFNLDFLMLLALLGVWVSWRHGHSWQGMLLGVLTTTGGAMFLFCYLLVELSRSKGDLQALLMGVNLKNF